MTSARGPVLHFIDTMGPGGAETVFLQVAAGLRERGWIAHTVVVGPGWVLDRVRELDLPVDVVPTGGRFDVRYVLGLRNVVRRHGIRLIHAHLFSPAVHASAIGAWTRTPVVATLHGAPDVSNGSPGRRIRYRLMDRWARVVCVSETLRQDALRLGLLRPDRVEVIHNGVDVAVFQSVDGAAVRGEHGIPRDTVLVGALGNIRPAKDYATLLRAAASLRDHPRLAFAIVGETTEPLYGELVALRDRLGMEDRVSFWGFRDDVPDVVAAFDILVISSSSEGFSLAAIQAMAAGTPVVATRSGGPEGIITDGEDGLLVPVGEADALAAAIRRLGGRPDLASRLADRARRTIRSRFSLERTLDGYESLYRELLTPGSSQTSTRSGTRSASSSI